MLSTMDCLKDITVRNNKRIYHTEMTKDWLEQQGMHQSMRTREKSCLGEMI